jgi:hypothetical protein
VSQIFEKRQGDSLHCPCLEKSSSFFDFCFQTRSYNKQMRPAILDHCSGNKWTNTSQQPEYLVGEEVRNIDNGQNRKKTADGPEIHSAASYHFNPGLEEQKCALAL